MGLGRQIVALSGALDRICRDAAMACLVLMVALIAIQVVARYGLSDPPGWTEEGARYAMVWSGFLGTTLAFRRGADPTLTSRALFSSGPWQGLGFALRAGAVGLFLGPVWYVSVFGPGMDPARGFLARTAVRSTESLGIPLIGFTLALPVAITVIFIHLLSQGLAREWTIRGSGEEPL
ncbi:TRAP transporter small permease [Microvirga pudoricolor]|uniref:TRAP transporter small permease n=1 Tax=Microvirga pudoricolor TaxID=2778729 RepID=UPI00194F0C6C|nr:TRAP transporter small permease subunit [Microvirga pudoricolor]MBM6593629.1 TRAP transporter small permease subunit [Microvirga pudoricolor]